MQHHGGQHARQLHVLREDRRAGRLGTRIGARLRALADVDEVLRVLERHIARHHLRRSASDEVAELGVSSALLVVDDALRDRKSTRLNSSHMSISYAVFCLKKKKI